MLKVEQMPETENRNDLLVVLRKLSYNSHKLYDTTTKQTKQESLLHLITIHSF